MEKSQILKPQVWVGILMWPLTRLSVSLGQSLGLLPESLSARVREGCGEEQRQRRVDHGVLGGLRTRESPLQASLISRLQGEPCSVPSELTASAKG